MLKPASLSRAPRAIKHAASGIAGLLAPLKDCKPEKLVKAFQQNL